MGEFITQTGTALYANSVPVVAESMMALYTLLRKPHYIRLIGAQWHPKILALKNDPRHAAQAPVIDQVMNKLKGK